MKSPLRLFVLGYVLFFLFWAGCRPLATQFDEIEDGVLYQADHPFYPLTQVDTVHVMTWNIRFGAGRNLPWFGDSCGDRVILTEAEVNSGLERIAAIINRVKPDILLLQEVDVKSKRTAYIDQVQWLLNHTIMNYAAYASSWQSQWIPTDGLGRMDMGNAILSRWPIIEHERIQLAQRSDQSSVVRYFYLQRCILKTKIDLPGHDNFYVLNIHAEAFSTDDTKRKHVERLKQELDQLNSNGALFIAGGDFNLLPPHSDSTDFCMEDRCSDESFHHPGDTPFHKEGSNYTTERTWMQPLYDVYQPDVPLAQYVVNQIKYFSHCTDRDGFWDRKLDYLFTNTRWYQESVVTHQECQDASDHAPVSAKWETAK